MRHFHFFQKRILVFLAFLCCAYSTYAQDPTTGNPAPATPSGFFDTVYDRFGTKYPLLNLSTDDRLRAKYAYNPSAVQLVTQYACTSGYFDIYLETGCGMENYATYTPHAQRLNVVCHVLHDLSAFIQSPLDTTGKKVRVLVRNYHSVVSVSPGPAAVASPYFIVPDAPHVSGIVDGASWITILSGQDAFTGVISPLVSSGGLSFYHGYIAMDTSLLWNTDLANLPDSSVNSDGYYDLYTVLLHESLHLLGFASLIDSNGHSRLGTNYPYYTRYDSHLQTSSNVNLIQNTPGSCNYMYNDSFFASTSYLTSSGTVCNPDHTDCGTAVKYVSSGVNVDVFTPHCWISGSSLSHFEDECLSPSQNNTYFLMSNASNPGWLPSPVKRYPKREERQVLCDIGYHVNDTFGNSSVNFSSHNYGGSACNGLLVAGINDGLNGFYYTFAVNSSSTLTLHASDLLGNDHNADSFACLQGVAGLYLGSFSVSSGSAAANTALTYTPASGSGGLQLFRYIPVNKSTGACGNITYLYIFVINGSCSPSVCTLIQNGEFENASNCGPMNTNTLPKPGIDCWAVACETPDLYNASCTIPAYTIPTSISPNITSTYPGSLPANQHFLGLYGGYDPNSVSSDTTTETMQTLLSSGLQNGKDYILSYWANAWVGAAFQFTVPTTEFSTCISQGPITAPYSIYPLPTGITQLTDTALPCDNMWHYYSRRFTYTGTNGWSNFMICNATALNPFVYHSIAGGYYTYIFVDDVSLKEVDSTSFDLPDTVTLCQIVRNLGSYFSPSFTIDSIKGPGVILSGGHYSFNPDSAGVGLQTITCWYTDNNGCLKTISDSIRVINSYPSFHITAFHNPICPGFTDSLSATGCHSCSWSTSNSSFPVSCSTCDTVTVAPTLTTTYTVTDIDSNGCLSRDTVQVAALPATATIVGPSSFCQGDSTAVVANTGPYLYQWQADTGTGYYNVPSPQGVNDTIFAKKSGNYRVKVYNLSSTCSTTSSAVSVVVYALATVALTDSPSSVCEGQSVTFHATGSAPTVSLLYKLGASQNYTATNNIGSSFINLFNTAGTYYFWLVTDNGHNCPDTMRTIDTVTVYSPPIPADSASTYNICKGDSIKLSANTGTGLSYQWQQNNSNISGATSSTYFAKQAGSYSVVETNSHGCMASSSGIQLTFGIDSNHITSSISGSSYGVDTICHEEVDTLKALVYPHNRYKWLKNGTLTSDTLSKYIVSYVGSLTSLIRDTFRVIVTDSSSCTDTSGAFFVVTMDTDYCPCYVWNHYKSFMTVGAGQYTPAIFQNAIQNYYVKDDITLMNGSLIKNVYINVLEGKSIYIDTNASIEFDSSHIWSACPYWKGFKLNHGHNTSAKLTLGNGCLVAYADTGVLVRDGVTPPLSSYLLSTKGTIFSNATVGVFIDSYVVNTPTAYPFSFLNTVFTAYDVSPTYNYWTSVDTLKIENCSGGAYNSPFYLSCNYSVSGGGAIGIMLRNVGLGNFHSGPSITSHDIVIGDPDIQVDENLFEKLSYGIYATNSNITLQNNSFADISLDGVYLKISDYTTSPPADSFGTLSMFKGNYTNRFWHCNNACVEAINAVNVIGKDASMISNQDFYSDSSIWGYKVRLGSIYGSINISNNQIYDISNGISLIQTGIPFYNSGVYPVIALPPLFICNNVIKDRINPSDIGPHHMRQAVDVESVFPMPARTPTSGSPASVFGQVRVDSNHIAAYNGIKAMTGWATCIYDSIRLMTDSINYPHPQYGIYFSGSTDTVFQSFINSSGLNDTTRGIYTTGAIEPWIRCNYVKDLNAGFQFRMSNPGTRWWANIMDNNSYGLMLSDSGTFISKQFHTAGDSIIGDEWINFSPPNQFHTYTTNNVLLIDTVTTLIYRSSPLCVLSTSPYVPTLNSSLPVLQQYKYDASNRTIDTFSSGTGPDCTSSSHKPANPEGNLVLGPLEEVALNTVPFVPSGGNGNIYSWMSQMNLYNYLQVDTVLLSDSSFYINPVKDSSAILYEFDTMAHGTRFEYLATTTNKIAQGLFTSAQCALNSPPSANPKIDMTTGVTVADNTDADYIFSNYTNYLQLLLKYLQGTMIHKDSVAVVTLAALCPSLNGTVVYNARTLYNLLFDDIGLWNDDSTCSVSGGGEGRGILPSVHSGTDTKQKYSLYPNPNNGNITLLQQIKDESPVKVNVFNAEGQCIYANKLLFKANMARLNLYGVVPGLYVVQLRDSAGNNYSFKFIVNE